MDRLEENFPPTTDPLPDQIGGTMDRLEESFPPTTDPLGYLSVLIDHLRAHFEVEVLGWEAQFDGSTTADILLRVSQRVTSNGGGPGSS